MAAELGEIAPHSYIGQPLAVDIELAALSPEEVTQGLQVRLALADVYRGANVMMNPALATVKLSVEKRGGRPVLHVSTTRPVDADYVHLYVEIGVPGRQEVRLATVWLQHDPNPPPPVVVAPPVPPASALSSAQAEQLVAQARAARPEAATAKAVKPVLATAGAGPGAAGNGADGAAAPGRDRGKPAPLPSVHEAETGVAGEVKAAQPRRIAGVLVSADGKPIKPSLKDETDEVPVRVAQALMPLAPLPLPKGVKRPASAPASCPAGGATAKECVALDHHNTDIAGKLSELEAKLKSLQGALGGPAAAKAAVVGHAGAASSAASAPAPAGHAAAAEQVASATLTAPGASTAHAAKAETAASAHSAASGAAAAAASAAAAGASASAEASAAASAPPTKQVRVLPKLKYKKEKPVEQPTDYTLPLAAGGVGLLALLGAGFIWWRSKKNVGKGPLKIWQGFRKKKAPAEAASAPVPAPESESETETVAQ